MRDPSQEQAARRERTLLTALLLSAPGALVTGLASLSSRSTTQLADFIRRGVELAALFVSWWVYHRLQRDRALSDADRSRLERAAGLSVAGAMIGSGLVMAGVALSRWPVYEPGGQVAAGLTIAVLGLIVNAWFWRRYTVLSREQASAVIAAQCSLYRAKASVDLCVVAALSAVAAAPTRPATRYVDLVGSTVVAGYLLWSGLRLAHSHLGEARRLFRRSRDRARL